MTDPARKTVLLVDDEEPFLLSFAEGLEAMDDSLDIILATDCAMALEMLVQCNVNLLVTDLKMPGMSGFELLERAAVSHPNLPTMVMTSGGSPQIEARVRDLGVSDYFEKPISLDDFVASIRTALTDQDVGKVDQEGRVNDSN